MAILTGDEPLEKIKSMQISIDEKKQIIENIEENFSKLDTTMNFKVNSSLKSEFEKVCKKSHSNASREIKLFMLRAIRQVRL